ncbi:hypothetical protein BJF83_17445 [Nocardiopsis sp. CNR-923]|uniref:hypothetical protein n=1 Tax=Nocardiopsis sp. CNR-923 TaxID=1904965 RepID=UPI00096990DD|nr:hypothetical protein [Nocardiopsis sp. CNR-923]OLT27768.1 hypothetical protein BJF83_17445 [Nocardiopsis sp. CNR-923]
MGGAAPTHHPAALGLDLSLTSTGVASSLGWAERIRPRTRGLDRLRTIVGRVRGYASADHYALAVIEGPAYGHGRQAGHDELAALRWMVRDALDRNGLPVAIVPPSTLKLWATGNGRAGKGDVAAAMDARHTGLGLLVGQRYDEADALALADMGAAWLDNWCLSPAQQRAMSGVTWPAGEVTAR